MSPSRLCRFAVFQYKPTFPTSSAGDQKDVLSGKAKTEEGDSQNSAEGAAFTTTSNWVSRPFAYISLYPFGPRFVLFHR